MSGNHNHRRIPGGFPDSLDDSMANLSGQPDSPRTIANRSRVERLRQQTHVSQDSPNTLENVPEFELDSQHGDESDVQAQEDSTGVREEKELRPGERRKRSVHFTDDSQDWQYSQHEFGAPRRLSLPRIQNVTGDLEITFCSEETEAGITEYLVIYHDKGTDTILREDTVCTFSNAEEMTQAMEDCPDEFFAVISKYADIKESADTDLKNAQALHDQAREANTSAMRAKAQADQKNKEIRKKLEEMNEKYRELQESMSGDRAKAQRYDSDIATAKRTLTRLRETRAELQKEIQSLTKRLADSEKLNQDLLSQLPQDAARVRRQDRPTDNLDTSDEEDIEFRRRGPGRGASRNTHLMSGALQREDTPATSIAAPTTAPSVAAGPSDNRYPNIDKFSAKEGEDIRKWIHSAKVKFKRSYAMFPDEAAKVDYLSGYLDGTAYYVARDRLEEGCENPYESAEDLFKDLAEAFGENDRAVDNLNAIIHGEFHQKSKEPVATWAARFLNALMRANIRDEQMKMYWAMQSIHYNLKKYAPGGPENETLRAFVDRMKNVERTFTIWESGKANQQRQQTPKGTTPSASKTAAAQDNKEAPKSGTTTPSLNRTGEQWTKIKRKGVCGRCFVKGHMWNATNAPCAKSKAVPFSKFDEIVSAAAAEIVAPGDDTRDDDRESGKE